MPGKELAFLGSSVDSSTLPWYSADKSFVWQWDKQGHEMSLSEPLLYYLLFFDYLLEPMRLELWHAITPPIV